MNAAGRYPLVKLEGFEPGSNTEENAKYLMSRMISLLEEADRLGVVLTVERLPIPGVPLAMRCHRPVVTMYPTR